MATEGALGSIANLPAGRYRIMKSTFGCAPADPPRLIDSRLA
jgi:hypothetical protein